MNLVVIEKNKYSFYVNKKKIVSIVSDDMTPYFVEYYRANPFQIFEDMKSKNQEEQE